MAKRIMMKVADDAPEGGGRGEGIARKEDQDPALHVDYKGMLEPINP
jgi:hypothetical protein